MSLKFITHMLSLLLLVTGLTARAQTSNDLASYVPGEVIIKFKQKSQTARQAHLRFMAKRQNRLQLKAEFKDLGIYHYALTDNSEVADAINDFKTDSSVEYVEPNYILNKMQEASAGSDASTSSDASASSLPSIGTYSQNYAPVQVTQAWAAMSPTSSKVPIVAVVDTGVDYTHKIFTQSNAIWTNPNEVLNGIDDDGNGYVDDIRGWNFYSNTNNPMDDDNHGTHVAGIILGVGQDIFANPVAAAKIKIMPLKFLGADGSGSTSNAVSAIYYAVNNGADIISNSWGGSSYSQSLHDALTYAYNNHLIIISAAGNSATNNDSVPVFPASLPVPSQITVAASSDQDFMASFSNYGYTSVQVAAPGVSILSSTPGNNFMYMSGTSMATPFVSGIAALSLREAPGLSGYQIKNIIVNAAQKGSAFRNIIASEARVNVYNAVVAAQSQVSILSSQPSYTATVPLVARNLASAGSSSSSGGGAAGCGLIKVISGGAEGSGGSAQTGLLLSLLLLPLLVWQVLRARANPANRRKYERFAMNSEIKLNVGGKDLVGQMKTISVGGASFSAEELLEKGGIVTLQIASPDGQEQIQVQGHIVWNEQNKSYGVQFEEAQAAISGWSKQIASTKS